MQFALELVDGHRPAPRLEAVSLEHEAPAEVAHADRRAEPLDSLRSGKLDRGRQQRPPELPSAEGRGYQRAEDQDLVLELDAAAAGDDAVVLGDPERLLRPPVEAPELRVELLARRPERRADLLLLPGLRATAQLEDRVRIVVPKLRRLTSTEETRC